MIRSIYSAGNTVTFTRALVNGTATGTADRTGEILHILRGCAQVKTSDGEKVWVRMVDLRPAEEVAK
jgi:ethanolamine utilization microcompartment shell protein EutL